MIRDKINSILKSKSFYVVFSIVASIALWTYVSYVQNPEVTVSVSGIAIEIENEDVLTQNRLILTNVKENSLTLNFHGKRNAVTHLSDNNVTATVDLNEIFEDNAVGIPGVYEIPYTVVYPSGVNSSDIKVSSASTKYITVTVERLAEKKLNFIGNYDGVVAEGYQAQPMEFTPEEITVSGPVSIVSKIDHAFVNIARTELSRSITEEMSFVLRDAENNVIDSDLLTLSNETVLVRLPISMIKEVALVVNFVEGASAKIDKNVTYTIDPISVTLSGDADILADLNQIVIGTIDLNTFAHSMTETFQIPIPNDVTNLTGETEATVTVEVTGVDTIQKRATNIQVKNETEGYKTEIVTKHLDLVLRGPAKDLPQIQQSNLRVVADLAELGNTTGTFSVSAKVFVDGFANVDAVGNYTITVVVSD